MKLPLLGFSLLLIAAPLPAVSSPSVPPDRAAALLAQHGRIAVGAAGPHVAIGTYRIQVGATLGRPDLRLGTHTWVYHRRQVTDSAAQGSLIVQFDDAGRVHSLSLATAAVLAALRAEFDRPPARGQLAAH